MEKKNPTAADQLSVTGGTTAGGTNAVTGGGREKIVSKSVGEALLKAALGCRVAEVTEEYAEVDGVLKLLKRKKTRKDIPPDLKAVQLLLETREDRDVSALSDEELEREKSRLLRLLKDRENGEVLKAKEGTKQEKLALAKKSGVKNATKTKRKAARTSAAKGKKQAKTDCESTAESAEKK